MAKWYVRKKQATSLEKTEKSLKKRGERSHKERTPIITRSDWPIAACQMDEWGSRLLFFGNPSTAPTEALKTEPKIPLAECDICSAWYPKKMKNCKCGGKLSKPVSEIYWP